ncbi:glucose-6-phosphate 1-epimerase [Clavulina sp. PMI_390]|nr:glucose-6-phosphate 1-epimerase [Clavulina sp. PMI_390]
MPVEQIGDKVVAALPGGSSVEVLLWGATVISWKAPAPGSTDIKERFFVSSKAALDGSKPVRGGIPIVFPFFGGATLEEHKPFASHGFARSEKWSYLGTAFETVDSISLKFELLPTPDVKSKWPQPFHLEYFVTISNHELGTKFQVTNPADSPSPLKHQALLHNYLAAAANSVTITPLKGLTYKDKILNSAEAKEERDEVDVRLVTDRVYASAPGTYDIKWTGGGMNIKTTGFPDVVIWNPQEEVGSKIGDMEDKGWERYVCVEPGLVSGWNEITPGETWRGTQLFIPL